MFLKQKPAAVITALRQRGKPTHLSELAREAGVTYVHLAKLVPHFVEKNIVQVTKKGKFRVVGLTKKGEELAALISDIKRIEES